MSKQGNATPSGLALQRGRFSDGGGSFTVRASSDQAPDSFQVYTNTNPADIVLIVSGLNSGNLRATWGDDWRSLSEEWKGWFKNQAFLVFYNGPAPALGKVRFCDG
ncbi:hypothetical protein [Glycomyces arizonensis]|uniref:hypothetical protein n=1 Tax=Glycomyces arizonensis TaxID=256035 RepID=UPI0012EB7091|nr:hypothetical protein [Glycomyces arizonensis]